MARLIIQETITDLISELDQLNTNIAQMLSDDEDYFENDEKLLELGNELNRITKKVSDTNLSCSNLINMRGIVRTITKQVLDSRMSKDEFINKIEKMITE